MNGCKHWSRSRTLIFNAVAAALLAAEQSFHLLQPLMPVDVYVLFAFSLAIGNAVIRASTSQPIYFRSPRSAAPNFDPDDN